MLQKLSLEWQLALGAAAIVTAGIVSTHYQKKSFPIEDGTAFLEEKGYEVLPQSSGKTTRLSCAKGNLGRIYTIVTDDHRIKTKTVCKGMFRGYYTPLLDMSS